MRPFVWLLLLSGSLLVGASCRAQQPSPGPAFRPTASIRDVMHTMVEPSAYRIWDSVAEISTVAGTEIKAPKTDEEWDEVKHGAIALRETTNLLLIEGRSVAYPGEKAQDPATELEPEQIEALINQDRQAFTRHVHALYDAVEKAIAAIDAKDPVRLMDTGTDIDDACESCHLTYWYPKKEQ